MGENVWKQCDSKINKQLNINIAQYKKKIKNLGRRPKRIFLQKILTDGQ